MSFKTHGGVGNHLAPVAAGQGALGGGVTTGYVSVADCARVGLLVSTNGNLTAGDTITVQFLQAENAAGTGSENLGTAQVYTVPETGESPEPAALEAAIFDREIAGLNADNAFLGATVTTSVATNGTITLLKAGLRFNTDEGSIA